MTRIRTDQPSSGRPFQLLIPSGGYVPTSFLTIAEAPDFSVPGTGDTGVVLDPSDSGRELRGGEVFLEAPLTCINNDTVARWVEVQILTQTNHSIPVTPPQLKVPAKEAIYVPIQGLRLLKTNYNSLYGDRLQIRASSGGALRIIGSAVELEALSHSPDSEA